MSGTKIHAVRHPWEVPEVTPEPDFFDDDRPDLARPTTRLLLSRMGIDKARQQQLSLTHNRRVVKIRSDGEFLYELHKYIARHRCKNIERLIGRYLMRQEQRDKELEAQHKESMIPVMVLGVREPSGRVFFNAATHCRTMWFLSKLAEDLLEEKKAVRVAEMHATIREEIAKFKEPQLRRSARIRGRMERSGRQGR
ncbi:hypothetical protein BDZ85DRAFT_57870 [Elsinoe ampelina]|uniref:Uncharacterized protein n=1 Tax=Elsinoe ampelina TaxID=302913 RepID=A0A6A6GMZ5_9PEZI|nr:hypothetical protein BDZ85DRAFT_57870 [Elsinoe ampelina]